MVHAVKASLSVGGHRLDLEGTPAEVAEALRQIGVEAQRVVPHSHRETVYGPFFGPGPLIGPRVDPTRHTWPLFDITSEQNDELRKLIEDAFATKEEKKISQPAIDGPPIMVKYP